MQQRVVLMAEGHSPGTSGGVPALTCWPGGCEEGLGVAMVGPLLFFTCCPGSHPPVRNFTDWAPTWLPVKKPSGQLDWTDRRRFVGLKAVSQQLVSASSAAIFGQQQGERPAKILMAGIGHGHGETSNRCRVRGRARGCDELEHGASPE